MRIFYTRFSKLIFTAFFTSLSAIGFSQTTYTVTTTADAGAGSLRDAITTLNGNGDPSIGDFIEFNIAGAGPHTITLASALPQITSTIFINGYSEPDAVMGPIGVRTISVRIDGGGIAAPIFDIGNGTDGNNVTIAGLNLANVGGNAVQLNDFVNGFRIWGCYIGTDITGTTGGAGNAITGAGVYLGISPGAQSGFSNSVVGVDSTYGFNEGLDADEGNVIGNCATGINSVGQQNLKVTGNYVGIGADGLADIGNTGAGILINTGSINCTVGVNDTTLSLPVNEKNYVGNNAEGITVRDGATGTVVAGNFVGVTPTGTNAGNSDQGIIIESAPANRIGTNADGVEDADERNTILYNGDGILLYNGANAVTLPGEVKVAIDNTIMGNTIDSNSVAIILDNQDLSGDAVTGNIIGSDGVGTNGLLEANLIRGNVNGGVLVESFPAPVAPIDLTRISLNSFEGNSSDQVTPGISIGFNSIGSIVANDCGDGDAGPNGQLNRPVIDAVGSNGVDSFFVSGWVEAGTTMEFYITSGSTTFGGTTSLPFGEPNVYLVTVTEGAAATTGITADLDATTTAYGDDGTGATCTVNRFKFGINFSALANPIVVGQGVGALAQSAASGPSNTSMSSALELTILPVTYVSFTATPSGNTVKLNWKTASESNSSHFDVQRSADGVSYSTIGSVTAAGNSQTTTNYDYVDANPVKGAISYYRLKQVDLDGKFEYSKVVLVKSSGSNNRFAISPNPVTSTMLINLVSESNETLSLRIIDNNGKVVKSYRQPVVNGANQIRLNDLGSIPNGVYILQISGKSTLINEKIMKY